jgi:DNA-binding NarL/FixJ family response regulator
MCPDPSAAIRLLLVDDHVIVRLGLRAAFDSTEDIRVIGEAGGVKEAVDAAFALRPDVVLMDMRMPDGTGVDACREIVSARPDARVLFLTSYHDDDALLSTVFAGARGFLVKEIGCDALLAAVRAVAAGQFILDPEATRVVAEKMKGLADSAAKVRTPESLSSQEGRVIALVADGKTNKEIAKVLGLSDKTVKNYLNTIFHKLQVGRRAHAAVIYRQSNPD